MGSFSHLTFTGCLLAGREKRNASAGRGDFPSQRKHGCHFGGFTGSTVAVCEMLSFSDQSAGSNENTTRVHFYFFADELPKSSITEERDNGGAPLL